MYIDKLIKKETITLIISVGLLLIVFIGVSFASFFKVDEGKDNVVETGDLAISFCNDSTCDTTYENIGQVIGTTKQNGTSVPSSIFPYPNDGTYSNATPYIFKVTNTGTMEATVTIKLNEDEDFLPSGNYSEYSRLTDLYANHLKVAIRKRVQFNNTTYQIGDVNMDGIVNQNDAALILRAAAELETLTSVQTNLADINGDGNVNATDAGVITQMLGGNDTIIEKMHIYSYNELSNNIIFNDEKIAPGASEIYFLWLYMDETTPNQAQKTYFVGNLDIQGEYLPDDIPFYLLSWDTIITNIKLGNTDNYNIGDTKEIDLGDLGKHNVRIANKSTPSECSTEGFSQTACGFVLEFEDIIAMHNMNPSGTYKGTSYSNGWNKDGWPASSMRTYVNSDIYNALPEELKNAIIDTTVVSGHGSSDTTNFTSTDKIYLLAPNEIYANVAFTYDTANSLTRQLDYYKSIGVTGSSKSGAIKNNGTNPYYWWLRSPGSYADYNFYMVKTDGSWANDFLALNPFGVSPAFRIG